MSVKPIYTIFKTGGKTKSFPIKLKENNNVDALGTAVTFKSYNYKGELLTNSRLEVVVDSPSEGAIAIGADYTLWDLATFTGPATADLSLLIYDETDLHYVKVVATATTSSPESSKDNNVGEWEIFGYPYKYIGGEVIEIPTSAFADVYNPTESELITWVDLNLEDWEKVNGTRLVYNPNILQWTAVWEDVSLSFSTIFTGNLTAISINGTTYAQDFPYNSSNTSVFDEVAYKTFIESSMVTEGVTGTVSVVDNGSSVDVTITSQEGIQEFSIEQNNTTYHTSENLLSYTNNVGNAGWDYVWTLHPDGSDYQVSLESKANKDGNILYVSKGALDDETTFLDTPNYRRGDSNYPISSIYKAIVMVLEDGDTIKVLPGTYTNYFERLSPFFSDLFVDRNIASFSYIMEDVVLDLNGLQFRLESLNNANSDIKILGYPDIINIKSTSGANLIDFTPEANSSVIIEIGKLINDNSVAVFNGTLIEYRGKYTDVTVNKVIHETGGNVNRSILSFNTNGANPDLVDKTTCKMHIGVVDSVFQGAIGEFQHYLDSNNVSDCIVDFTFDTVHQKTTGLGRIFRFSGGASVTTGTEQFGLQDSSISIKGNIYNQAEEATSSPRTPYSSLGSSEPLLYMNGSLYSSTYIVDIDYIKSNNTFFSIKDNSPFEPLNPVIDNSLIHIKNIKGEAIDEVFSVLSNEKNVYRNNSKILFENCDIISLNSFIADFDLDNGTHDGTTKIVFKNCRLETKATGESLIYSRNNLWFENCLLINDGTTDIINTDSSITAQFINTWTNSNGNMTNVTQVGLLNIDANLT